MNYLMKKYDVIVVGELNVDLILNQLEKFPESGKEVFARQMSLTLGSSAAIFANNLSSFGAKVAFIGKVGKDVFGNLVLQSLEKKNVDTSMIIRSDELETGATIGLNLGADRAMVTFQGAMENLCFSDIPLEKIRLAKHLHFSSFFFQPGIKNHVATLFREAKLAGLTTSFDMQSDPADKWDIDYQSILPYVDIFLPNEKELLTLSKKNTIEEAIDVFKDHVNILAVKLGQKGSVTVHDNNIIYQPAFNIENFIDAIGAGDSFNAGFIYQFLKNAPVESCQSFGNLAGAVSTTAPGGTAAFDDVQNLVQHAHEKFGYTATGVT